MTEQPSDFPCVMVLFISQTIHANLVAGLLDYQRSTVSAGVFAVVVMVVAAGVLRSPACSRGVVYTGVALFLLQRFSYNEELKDRVLVSFPACSVFQEKRFYVGLIISLRPLWILLNG